MQALSLAAIALILILPTSLAQENTGTNVASSLRQCYNTSALYEHDYRLPSTINMLIDLIRLIEDGAQSSDARVLSMQIIQRFRQDGITFDAENKNPNILPYSPNSRETFKNNVLLQKLVPGSAKDFPNSTLTVFEQCGLHFILSTSIERQRRNDEATTCKRAGEYVRYPRDPAISNVHRRVRRDTEELAEPEPDAVLANVEILQNEQNYESDCPVENGIVFTRWGNVNIGTVLAAIAAGLEPQSIDIEYGGYKADNRYSVTLAGDLAEVALQGASQDAYPVGRRGGWNSTLAPHWYFQDGRSKVYLTDAELRGDLDGLILGLNVREWMDRYQGMRISQLLDMYYSNRGVFSSEFKACNRNKFATQYANRSALEKEVVAFAHLYNKEVRLSHSPDPSDIDGLVRKTLDSYDNNVASVAYNVQCDGKDLNRIATDLIIVVDASWEYKYIHQTVSYLLDNLDINKYDSNYTVINAMNGSVLVGPTWSMTKFHQAYNYSIHQQMPKGFDAYKTMDSIEALHRDRAEALKTRNHLGGKSSTVIMFLKSTDSSQGSYLSSRYSSVFDQFYPDTNFLVVGAGSKDIYRDFVRNIDTDVFQLPNVNWDRDDEVVKVIHKAVQRVGDAPRKLVNPRCGAAMSGETGSTSMDLFVEPGTGAYYKVARNFLTGEGGKSIKFKLPNGGNVTICTSTTDAQPTTNCEALSSGEKVYDMSGADAFHVTLQGGVSGGFVRCAEAGCRFPDNIRVTVQAEGLSCDNNGAMRITGSLVLFISLIMFFYNH